MSTCDFRFRMAVEAILKNWSALQMVVTQGAAGPESANIAAWMVDATVQWFGENKDLQADEVEDFLLDIINQYFNVLVQDGSAEEIGQLICSFFSAAADKNTTDESFRTSLQKALPKCDLSVYKVPAEEDNNDIQELEEENNLAKDLQELNVQEEKSDEQESISVNKEPIVDADGFTTVVSSSSRRRQKKK